MASPALAAPAAAGATLVSEITPNGALDFGEGVAMSFCITNPDASPTPPLTGTLQVSGNVSAPSGPQRYGSLAPGETACRTYTFQVVGACAQPVTATVALTGGTPSSVSYVLPTAASSGAPTLQEGFDGASTLPPGWLSSLSGGTSGWVLENTGGAPSPPNLMFAPNPAVISEAFLVSSIVVLPATPAVLTFRNSFDLETGSETGFDGGVLEIAIAGGAYQDVIAAGGVFLEGGYTSVLSSAWSNPLGGRAAWSGNSGGFVTTRVRLPAAAAGQGVRLRWRLGTDSSTFDTGWAIDSVSIDGTSCAPAPQNVPWGLHADVHGNNVALAWVQPLSGAVPEYVLEVSVDGGGTFPLSFPVGAATAFQATGPDAVFVARVRGLQAGGGLTAPSGPVTIALGSTLAPPKPRNVVVTTTGNALNLAWSLDEVGGRSSAVVLEAGTAPGAANLGPLPLPPGTTSFAIGGVGNGTYFVRLRQQGPALASQASHEISFTLPGACVAPVVPPNLTVTKDGSGGVIVFWDLGAVGTAAPTGWVLEAGTAPGLSDVGAVPLPQRFLFAPTVGAGNYFVRVFAQNVCGSSPKTADVSFTMP